MDLTLLNHQTWHPGRILSFSALDGVTDQQHGLVLQAADKPGWNLRVPGEARIRFPSDTPHNFWTSHDAFRWESESGFVTCGVMIDAHHILIKGYTSVITDSDALQFLCCGEMLLLGVAGYFRAEYIDLPIQGMMNQRLQWLARVPEPKGLEPGDLGGFARACSQMKGLISHTEEDETSRCSTPDRRPHQSFQPLDTAFHAFGFRHIAPGLARELLTTVLQQQSEDGFIPQQFGPAGRSDLSFAPLLAWAAWEVFQGEKNREWLEEVYPLLTASLAWYLSNRDSDGNGLLEWQVEVDEDGASCGSIESGMPGSPRFEHAVHLDAVDFSAFLSRDFECLNFIARELGQVNDQAIWRGRHFQLNAMMRQRLWNPSTHFFHDFDLDRKDWSPVMAVTGFLPLICGGASREQIVHLIAHLHDPASFGSPVPIPSLALNSRALKNAPWRGATSVVMNWLVAEGLDRCGFRKEAKQIRAGTAGEMTRRLRGHGSLCAFYDAMGKKTNGNTGSLPVEHGCSSALFVDWMCRKVRSDRSGLRDTQ